MKKLRTFLIVIIVLAGALAGAAFLLPDSYSVERRVVINAKPRHIYPLIEAPNKWPSWTAWNKERDPSVTFIFEGKETGAGASYRWSGKKFGEGSLTITRADSNKSVAYDIEFDRGRSVSHGTLTLAEVGDATEVVWAQTGGLGMNPLQRYSGLAMDFLLGRDFEQGLSQLKRIVEASR